MASATASSYMGFISFIIYIFANILPNVAAVGSELFVYVAVLVTATTAISR